MTSNLNGQKDINRHFSKNIRQYPHDRGHGVISHQKNESETMINDNIVPTRIANIKKTQNQILLMMWRT